MRQVTLKEGFMAKFSKGASRREERKISHRESVLTKAQVMARRVRADMLAGLDEFWADEADYTKFLRDFAAEAEDLNAEMDAMEFDAYLDSLDYYNEEFWDDMDYGITRSMYSCYGVDHGNLILSAAAEYDYSRYLAGSYAFYIAYDKRNSDKEAQAAFVRWLDYDAALEQLESEFMDSLNDLD